MEAAAVIWAPVRSLGEVARERRVLLGFGVTALHAALNLVVALITVLGGLASGAFRAEDFPAEVPPELREGIIAGVEVGSLVYAVLSPFVGWVVVSLLMQLATSFFGGNGPLSGMFAAVGVAGVPLVLAVVAQIPLTGLQAALGAESTATAVAGFLASLLLLGAYLWNVVLVIIGAASARSIGYGQSTGSCAISCAGCFGLIIVVFVALIAVAALAGSIAASQ